MKEKGIVSTGWGLVLRHQRILWWVFIINALLGYLATIAPRTAFSAILDHSMVSQKFVNGFNLFAWAELISKPEVPFGGFVMNSITFVFMFFGFMLFITGGILVAYRHDRKLTAGEFFQASGEYFWRMLRLVLMSLVPFAVVGFLWTVIYGIGGTLTDTSANERLGYYIIFAGAILTALLTLAVRLWFDVAQVRAVAQNEHGMFHNLMRSFVITAKASGGLLWIYFRISLVAWIALAAGLWLRARIPANQVLVTWLVLEVVLLLQILTRLWQRAASVTWYARYAETHPMAVVDYTTPEPAEVAEPAPVAMTETAIEQPLSESAKAASPEGSQQ